MDTENKNNQISSYLKTELDKKNITQKVMQEDLGVSQQYVSALLNGGKSVGKKMAKKLSELYDLDESILLGARVMNEEAIISSEKISLIKNKPHDQQMQILLDKIEDLETKVLIHQERDRLYLKSIIEHLGINDENIESELEINIKNKQL